MNKILAEIVRKMGECLNAYLPEISCSDLEEDGTVYYMNGKNGTEFDWHVNDRLSNFMVFYDDAEKFVEFSDMRNVRTCLEKSGDADLILRMTGDGEYAIINK